MALLPIGVSGEDAGYQISRSLRFNSADSAYLNRTPASAGNRRTMTYSFWHKRSTLGTSQQIISAGSASPASDQVFIGDTNIIRIYLAGAYRIETTAVYRDPSSWYHIVLAIDTTQATGSNRVRLYINNAEVTAFTGTTISQNTDIKLNDATAHYIGRYAASASEYLNGYLTEINFIDGQALTPSSFGETDLTTGVWKPKKYTGTYGTNGFYLNFSDNSGTTATTLGKDLSGNGNNWTPNNFSVTAGAGNDSLVDVPTLWGSDTGAGGEVRGNYATLNPLDSSTTYSISNGNLYWTITASSSNTLYARATMAVASGKWYWEITPTNVGDGGNVWVGIQDATYTAFTGAQDNVTSGYAYKSDNGNKVTGATLSSYGASYTNNDVIGVALDMDAGTLTFYKNGVSQGQAFSSISGTYRPLIVHNVGSVSRTSNGNCNFGQRPFAYTAPSGFKALCTTNLPEPSIKQGGSHFSAKLWTGNGATQSITGVGFQPDLVWTKDRGAAFDHTLFDAVRGATNFLRSNATSAEETRTDSLTSFNSDGFSVGADAVRNNINKSSASYVSWNWKANGTGVSNTAGSITSTVSANTTAGFSIVTYTGTKTSSGSDTVGHGLGVAPSMIIVKRRNAAYDWPVGMSVLGWNSTDLLMLNTTGAKGAIGWNDFGAAPTSTVFTVSYSNRTNIDTGTFVAYCFSEVAGYSRFGSFVANGSSDGVFVWTGMRPRWVLLKLSSGSENWAIFDTARDTYNVAGNILFPNLSDAELSSPPRIDILSNGFKVRSAGGSLPNTSSGTYIYAAFAEFPFKTALAR